MAPNSCGSVPNMNPRAPHTIGRHHGYCLTVRSNMPAGCYSTAHSSVLAARKSGSHSSSHCRHSMANSMAGCCCKPVHLSASSRLQTPPLFPEPTHGGRSACADCPAWLLAPLGRLDGAPLDDAPLPKPCGARPRSVAFPCADQVRDPLLLPGRFADALPFDALPFTDARPLTLAPAFADGGLLPLPLRAPKPPLLAPLLPPRFIPPFTAPFPAWPADSPRVSIVRTGMCEAAAPGAVRAITGRLATDAGGIDTRPRASPRR